MKGQLDGKLTIDMRIARGSRNHDATVRVAGVVNAFSIDKLVGKERFEQGALNLTFDPTGLKANGQGRLFGAPANLEIKKPSSGAAEAVVQFSLDDAARSRMGFGAGAGLTGVVNARIVAPFARDEESARVELDLSRAAIDGDAVGRASVKCSEAPKGHTDAACGCALSAASMPSRSPPFTASRARGKYCRRPWNAGALPTSYFEAPPLSPLRFVSAIVSLTKLDAVNQTVDIETSVVDAVERPGILEPTDRDPRRPLPGGNELSVEPIGRHQPTIERPGQELGEPAHPDQRHQAHGVVGDATVEDQQRVERHGLVVRLIAIERDVEDLAFRRQETAGDAGMHMPVVVMALLQRARAAGPETQMHP